MLNSPPTSCSSVDVEELSVGPMLSSAVLKSLWPAECFPALRSVRIQLAAQKANGAQKVGWQRMCLTEVILWKKNVTCGKTAWPQWKLGFGEKWIPVQHWALFILSVHGFSKIAASLEPWMVDTKGELSCWYSTLKHFPNYCFISDFHVYSWAFVLSNECWGNFIQLRKKSVIPMGNSNLLTLVKLFQSWH
jgi:hypothetical protein